jgi:hypothetical protein
MDMYLLSITAVFTLVLNIFLSVCLLKDKLNINSYNTKKDHIINFVLAPDTENVASADAEVAETEMVLPGDAYNG